MVCWFNVAARHDVIHWQKEVLNFWSYSGHVQITQWAIQNCEHKEVSGIYDGNRMQSEENEKDQEHFDG